MILASGQFEQLPLIAPVKMQMAAEQDSNPISAIQTQISSKIIVYRSFSMTRNKKKKLKSKPFNEISQKLGML